MPKKPIFKKSQIRAKAFELFEKQGLDNITARNLAKYMNSSPTPLYGFYSSIDELKSELIEEAKHIFMDYVLKPRTDLLFLNIGMGISIFAREEKELFKSIFLRGNSYAQLLMQFRDIVKTEMEKDERFVGLPAEFRDELFLDCWLSAHGLATLIVTDYFENPTDEYIKERLLSSAAVLLYKKIEDYNKEKKKKK